MVFLYISNSIMCLCNLTEDILITHFYGKQSADSDCSKPGTPTPMAADSAEEGEDLASVVKRRRITTAQAMAERKKKEEEERIM